MSFERELFRERTRTLHDLEEVQHLVDWDQQVMMPSRGAEQRSLAQAALARVVHQQLTAPELGELIEQLSARTDLDADTRADLAEARRAHQRACRVPEALVAERARVCSLAQQAWQEAREHDAFDRFAPQLGEVLRLTREVAAALGGPSLYDALLEEYEPGMTEAALSTLFDELRGRLAPLLGAIAASSVRPRSDLLRRRFPCQAQERLARRMAADLGFDFTAGRLDVSVHPFTSGTLADVRITNRYREDHLPMAIFGVLHETGHALYEQGLDPARYRDPAGGFCSLGVHESQSRFWENVIGRSRPFWTHYLPVLREVFPGVLDDVGPEELYRAVNVIEPSLIRVDADELTYNLHIILRFELERALLSGDLPVAELPGAWRQRMQDLLGLTPETDREGALQDVHWSLGLIGYFPTYALGNLYAAQFAEALRRDLPDLDERIGRGELGPIRSWLNRRIHSQGRRHLAPELCRLVTGAPLSVEPSLTYLRTKLGELYRL